MKLVISLMLLALLALAVGSALTGCESPHRISFTIPA